MNTPTKRHFVARDVVGDDYFGASFEKKHLSETQARELFSQSVLALLRTFPEDERTPQQVDLYAIDWPLGLPVEQQYARIEYDGPPGDWYVKEKRP